MRIVRRICGTGAFSGRRALKDMTQQFIKSAVEMRRPFRAASGGVNLRHRIALISMMVEIPAVEHDYAALAELTATTAMSTNYRPRILMELKSGCNLLQYWSARGRFEHVGRIADLARCFTRSPLCRPPVAHHFR